VKAIAENIVEQLKEKEIRPEHIEGLQGGRWVLIDYIDFVVHVFHEEARQFYQLEVLWGDAPRLEFEG
jgi:ribosome-associated protein